MPLQLAVPGYVVGSTDEFPMAACSTRTLVLDGYSPGDLLNPHPLIQGIDAPVGCLPEWDGSFCRNASGWEAARITLATQQPDGLDWLPTINGKIMARIEIICIDGFFRMIISLRVISGGTGTLDFTLCGVPYHFEATSGWGSATDLWNGLAPECPGPAGIYDRDFGLNTDVTSFSVVQGADGLCP